MTPFNEVFRLIGLVLIVIGLFNIAGRNFLWKIEQAQEGFWGKRVERTGLWDFWKILGGLIMLFVGAIFLIQKI